MNRISGRLLLAGAMFIALFALSSEAVAQTLGLERARTTISFDPGWRFLKGDAEGAEQAGFDDSSWRQVDVPHDWSIEGPYDENAPSNSGGGYLPSGISWYRKEFTLPAENSDRRAFVEFDGVMANSDVWINGHHLGKRPYGYVSFSYELTGHLNFGNQPNVLAVRTDTTLQPASRWYTGQGIYRHVRLVVTHPVHIEHWGVFVTTPEVTPASATIRVQTAVINQSEAQNEVTLKTTLFDPDGNPVGSLESTQTVSASDRVEFQQDISIDSPRLWNLDAPNLYRTVSQVAAGGKTLDDQVTTFGIRQFQFKSDTGFWLNGNNVKIYGVCLHHGGGAVGAAVPLRVWERRLELLRTIGVNAIRTAHNPPAPEFLDLCDRMGFLVMDETFDTWTAAKNHGEKGYNLYFEDWWEADTRDTILRDRNHPSVILWSAGNEIRDDLNSEAGRNRFIAQRDLIHRLDSTRPVTMGLFRPRERGHIPRFTDLLDVVGINYRPNQLADVARSGRPVIGTEETHALSRWAPIRDNPSIPGTFLWTGIDYLGETSGWPYVVSGGSRSSGFGLLDISGVFHARAWQRQSWWTTKPMVHAVRYSEPRGRGEPVSDWTPSDPDAFDRAKIEVYSNCEEVELFLNGESLGGKPMPRRGDPAVWNDVTYQPGTLKVVGKNNGEIVATHELRTAGEPAKIVLSADRSRIADEFDDVSHVTAKIVDENGILCPNADDALSFKITGPGKIVALSTGERNNHHSFQSHERKAFQGRCLAIVRSTADSGEITLSASTSGLEPETITLEAVPAPE